MISPAFSFSVIFLAHVIFHLISQLQAVIKPAWTARALESAALRSRIQALSQVSDFVEISRIKRRLAALAAQDDAWREAGHKSPPPALACIPAQGIALRTRLSVLAVISVLGWSIIPSPVLLVQVPSTSVHAVVQPWEWLCLANIAGHLCGRAPAAVASLLAHHIAQTRAHAIVARRAVMVPSRPDKSKHA